MEDRGLNPYHENDEDLYNEKNDAVIAPDSYYADKISSSEDTEERYYEVLSDSKPKSKIFSVISLILGIASILFGFVGWVALILGAAAVALSVVSRIKLGYFDAMGVAGLILGIFGVVFGMFYTVLSIILGADGFKDIIYGLPEVDTDGSPIDGI